MQQALCVEALKDDSVVTVAAPVEVRGELLDVAGVGVGFQFVEDCPNALLNLCG